MILVAGATGHLGVPLVKLLAARGTDVRVLSRNPARAHASVPEDVKVIEGDVRFGASLAAAVEGVETVISAVTGFGPGGDGPRSVDLDGNHTLIEAAVAAGVRHFILVSIHGASATHPMELYRAKFAAEERLRASGLEWTIVRPTVFLELWTAIVGDPLLKTGTATVFGRGDNPVNFVSVHDVARSIEQAVVDPALSGRTIEVAGPQNLTLNHLVESIAKSSGRQARSRHIPVPALRLGAAVLRRFRPDIAGLLQAAVLMDTTDMCFDSREITDMTGTASGVPITA
jgi:NADH dehydrogenase